MKIATRARVLAAISIVCLLAASHVHAKSDPAFMKDAAEASSAEVEASKLAQTKARRPEVRAYANTMINDHAKLTDELRQLARSKNVNLPDGPTLIQKSKIELINLGNDANFDERYIKSFGVKAHEDAVKLFEDASRDTKDAEVRAFADKSLPSLRHHLDMAKTLDAH